MPNPTKTIGQLTDNADAITGTEQLPVETASGTRRDTLQDLVHGVPADPRYQTADADLTAIAGLSDTGYLVRTGPGTWVQSSRTDANKIQGRDIASTAPNDGQVLKWNQGAGQWQPGAAGISDLNYTPPTANSAIFPG